MTAPPSQSVGHELFAWWKEEQLKNSISFYQPVDEGFAVDRMKAR